MEEPVERLTSLFHELDRQYGPARSAAGRSPITMELEPVGPAVSPPVITHTIAVSPGAFRLRSEIGPLLGKLRNVMGQGGAMILHLTSAAQGAGVSTVARELVCAAGAIPAVRALLLDCNTGGNDQSNVFGQDLPSAAASYMASGHAEVAAVEAGEAVFHAATMTPGPGADGRREPGRMADLYRILRGSYDLIVLDCPPVLKAPYFVRMTQDPPEIVLVVQAEKTRIPAAMRAKDEIAQVGGRLAGVIMNKRRFFIPKFIYRRI